MSTVTLFDEPLANLLDVHGHVVFPYPVEKIWNPKGISLKNRLANAAFAKQIQDVLQPKNVKKYLVTASAQAATRCIDGRIMVGWENDKKLQTRPLGPKIAGGTAHAALAHRIVDAEHLRKNLIFEKDITYIIGKFKELGIGFGGHVDDHQKGSNTGCGAVDNINLILERLQRPEPQEQLRGLTRMILGDGYNGRLTVNEVIGRMLYLDALKPLYMPKKNGDPKGEYLYKRTIVETIRKQADELEDNVPQLAGAHNEVAVILNFVQGTTFDSDRFSYDNKHEIQAFGWDIWQMYDEAQRLYPYDMHFNEIDQVEAITDRMRYITTRTLLGISTTMVLTDGSLRVLVVEPES